MSKPNMYCGECSYWLAYSEPETTSEQSEAILAHCAECDACDGRCFNCDCFDYARRECGKEKML